DPRRRPFPHRGVPLASPQVDGAPGPLDPRRPRPTPRQLHRLPPQRPWSRSSRRAVRRPVRRHRGRRLRVLPSTPVPRRDRRQLGRLASPALDDQAGPRVPASDLRRTHPVPGGHLHQPGRLRLDDRPRAARTHPHRQPRQPDHARLRRAAGAGSPPHRPARTSEQCPHRRPRRAAVSLALGSGIRHGTLTNITTYEIPPVVATPFTTMRIPDFITKGDAGGEAWIFSHRLKLVHAYINGARAELIADGRPYRPESPIQLDDADEDRWTATVDGTRRSVRWAETTDEVRRRLVTPDGSTPSLLLNGSTPAPPPSDQVGTITATARDWTRLHLAPDFPARFRTHDLRHTYA